MEPTTSVCIHKRNKPSEGAGLRQVVGRMPTLVALVGTEPHRHRGIGATLLISTCAHRLAVGGALYAVFFLYKYLLKYDAYIYICLFFIVKFQPSCIVGSQLAVSLSEYCSTGSTVSLSAGPCVGCRVLHGPRLQCARATDAAPKV